MSEDMEEKPVTLSQLKAVLAEFRVAFKSELKTELKTELKSELRAAWKEDMTSLLARFYADILEPRFQAIDDRFNRVDAKLDEHDRRFDHLYKKVEVLHHEYIISNEQIRDLRVEISQKLSH